MVVAAAGPGALRFPVWFRLFIIMIRTEDKMNRNVWESQSLPWFLSCNIRPGRAGRLGRGGARVRVARDELRPVTSEGPGRFQRNAGAR